jgi:hypothetical protein
MLLGEQVREKVLNGEVAVFKIKFLKSGREELVVRNGEKIRDLLIGTNAERLADLTTLYEKGSIRIDGVRYEVLCGFTLIADLMCEVTEFMSYIAKDREVEEIDDIEWGSLCLI